MGRTNATPSRFQTYQKSTSNRNFANQWKTLNQPPYYSGQSVCAWVGRAPYVWVERLANRQRPDDP